jgi:hypothetical protein
MLGGWCGSEIESSFGPTVQNCRSGFDFTFFFEQLILSIIPSTIFLVCSIGRVLRLHRSASKARAGWLLPTKIVSVPVPLPIPQVDKAITARRPVFYSRPNTCSCTMGDIRPFPYPYQYPYGNTQHS